MRSVLKPTSSAWLPIPPAVTGSAMVRRRQPTADVFLPANVIEYVIVTPGPAHRRNQGRDQRAGHGDGRHAVGHGDVVMDGVLIRPHLDSNGRDLAIEHLQDVEPILQWNRQARRDEQRSDWGRHVARIPNVIYVKWLDEEHAGATRACGCSRRNSI
jgi:hypothetical protein